MYAEPMLEYLEKHGKIAGKLPMFGVAQIISILSNSIGTV